MDHGQPWTRRIPKPRSLGIRVEIITDADEGTVFPYRLHLATEKISAEHAVMIGDRAGDIVAARAHHVRSIGVLWGYGSKSELVDARADVVCASPNELAACVSRIAI